MPRGVRRLARLGPALNVLLPYLDGRGAASIRDPGERTRSLAFGVTSPRLVRELYAVVRAARRALPRVEAPSLVVHSSGDHRIAAADARGAFAALGARRKELAWVDDCGHVVTVDYGRERVLDAVAAWLDDAVPAAARRVPAPGVPA
jgi:carboxylesterase